MVYLKNAAEIANIKAAVTIWEQVKTSLIPLIVPGNTGLMLDAKAQEIITLAGGECTFLGYDGFPNAICVSVNETVIHGVPNQTCFQPNDKVSVDIGVTLNGGVCDAAFTILVPPADDPVKSHIINTCKQATYHGLAKAVGGGFVGDIGHAIASYAHAYGFSILENFGGHGCGLKLHEDPFISNFGKPKTGKRLVEGMVLCVEPMLVSWPTGKYSVDSKDCFSVRINTGGYCCHWEHMVLINAGGHEVLTATAAEKTVINQLKLSTSVG